MERLRVRTEALPCFVERAQRRPVALAGFALVGDGSTFAITVVDLAYDGCKIETPIALMLGLRIKLSVLGLGALDAQVRWYADGCAGLRFNEKASATEARTQRAYERLDLSAAVSLRRSARPTRQARIFDLAPSGCKVEFEECPRAGETIWVKFEHLDALESEVRWIEGPVGGVEFVRPIYPAVFQLLITRLQERWR